MLVHSASEPGVRWRLFAAVTSPRRRFPVVVVEGAKGVEDDLCAVGCVSGLNWPQRHLSSGWRRGRFHHRCFMDAGGRSRLSILWRAAPALQAGQYRGHGCAGDDLRLVPFDDEQAPALKPRATAIGAKR